jgi:hypothetical protein
VKKKPEPQYERFFQLVVSAQRVTRFPFVVLHEAGCAHWQGSARCTCQPLARKKHLRERAFVSWSRN